MSVLPPTCILLLAAALGAPAAAFERTEEREPCAHYTEARQPLFGDLHVHSSYSFDSYISSQRNTPWAAYRYATGEPIELPDEKGAQNLRVRIERPLDFAAVTDHAEFLGPINLCTDDSSEPGYWFPACIMTRSNIFIVQLLAADYWQKRGVSSGEHKESFVCKLADCDAAHRRVWRDIQRAAEDHYDRTSECNFTTFIGYEYTDAPGFRNLHRNVIFRNKHVTRTAISAIDTGSMNFPELWRRLRAECIEGDKGCDVLAIPHNPNLSGGFMFRDPETPEEAEDRLFFEPVVELVQHKAASECRFDRLRGFGLDTEDELCDFEQAEADNLAMLGTIFGEIRTEGALPVPLERFGRRNMVRNALKDGLALQRGTGVNPFKMGFIGSTDTHSATPGGAEEYNYAGHLGRRDVGYRNVQDHFFDNPGGLAVVWAEENSRDAIFAALRRREAYATSGTRPVVRFFAGDGLSPALCDAGDMAAQAYGTGVPMGGELDGSQASGGPAFLVSAQKDPGTPANPGNDLQRLQIIKGWIDAEGRTHEKVFEVAGNPDNGAHVNPEDCRPLGAGFQRLCEVWRDPEFNAQENAFYYARALENPSCRWSTRQCQAAGVNPFSDDCAAQAAAATEFAQEDGAIGDVYGKCCIDSAEHPFYSPVIQERAWTSPIWYNAATARRPLGTSN